MVVDRGNPSPQCTPILPAALALSTYIRHFLSTGQEPTIRPDNMQPLALCCRGAGARAH